MDDSTNDGRTITLSEGEAAARTHPAGIFTIVHPPRLSRRVELGRGALVFGRQPPDPSGELADGTVSRRHLRISWDGRSRGHLAADLESRNGSWLDGVALAGGQAPLRDGTVVRLGAVVAVYEQAGLDPEDEASLRDEIPGDSWQMRRLRRQIARAAADPSPALVTGPTGAGKEHVVRALHRRSMRPGPFVAVNVTELSPQLAESQLFGHVRGAFTGAVKSQPGLIRSAEGGTLFLDEIGELPKELQPKLLRVIQEREVRPVGGIRTEPFDVRIVAATNRDLLGEVDAGRFRRDLWARLSLWELSVPPLSRRRADLPGWIARLHQRWRDERDRDDPPLRFDPEAVEALLLADWPENLRGVDRLVHRLATGPTGEPITLVRIADLLDLPSTLANDDAEPSRSTPEEPVRIKRPAPETARELEEILDRFDGSVRATARWYGRHRRQIYRWIDALGVERGED